MNYDMSSYFEDPEFKEALARYEGMVENHTPAYFEADELTDIAEYYASKGRHKDADKAINLAIQLHPDNIDALIFRARSLMLLGKKEEAQMVMQLINNPADREFRFLQADLLIEEEHMEEADKILQQLAMDEEYELDTLLDIILDYVDVNQKEYAKKWIDCLFAHFDMQTLPETNQRLRDVLCDYYSTFNKPKLAIPYLNMTLNEFPYSVQHWNELGKCYLQQEQYEKAHEAFDFALAIDENNTETLTLKAFLYSQTANIKESINYYLRLEKATEKKPPVYMALAGLHFEMKDYETAMKYTQKLLKQKQEITAFELTDIYSIAALCHVALGHPEEGYMYLDQVLKQNGNDAETRIYAGQFFTIMAGSKDISEEERKNNIDKAEEQFNLALEFTPKEERMDILFKIGSKYFDEHLFEYANRYFEQINKEFPHNAHSTYFFLIYGYLYLQQPGPFIHYLAKINKELPDTYAALGVDENAQFPDQLFNEAIRVIKDDISKGKLNLNNYLYLFYGISCIYSMVSGPPELLDNYVINGHRELFYPLPLGSGSASCRLQGSRRQQ